MSAVIIDLRSKAQIPADVERAVTEQRDRSFLPPEEAERLRHYTELMAFYRARAARLDRRGRRPRTPPTTTPPSAA